jgi:hypothetical protein
VMQNIPAVKEQFGRLFGLADLNERSLIAAAIDPDIGLGLLQRRITQAQIAAEASERGFDRPLGRLEALSSVLDQDRARSLFSEAQRRVPQFGRLSQRFRSGEFGIEEFEEATVFGDSAEQQRMRRLAASEQAMFQRGGVSGDRTGLSGLRER